MVTEGSVRFEAEWISKQHQDSNGEWNPDRDEYTVSHFSSRKLAERAAIINGKLADQCSWIRVTEQRYQDHEWTDVRNWVGDWEGLSEEPYECETA